MRDILSQSFFYAFGILVLGILLTHVSVYAQTDPSQTIQALMKPTNANRSNRALYPKVANELVQLKNELKYGMSASGVKIGDYYFEKKRFRDAAQCMIWSAKLGNLKAARHLSAYYVLGLGVPQDQVMAYAWANLAATSGKSDDAQFRATIGKQLTFEQIHEAQAISRLLPLSQTKILGVGPCE